MVARITKRDFKRLGRAKPASEPGDALAELLDRPAQQAGPRPSARPHTPIVRPTHVKRGKRLPGI